jgi:hypothetical protein
MGFSGHDDIARFMEARQRGDSSREEMVYNPVTKKFELVDRASANADALPRVTAEDLQAFHG